MCLKVTLVLTRSLKRRLYHSFWLTDPLATQTNDLQAPHIQCGQIERAAKNCMAQKLSKMLPEHSYRPGIDTTSQENKQSDSE